MSVLLAHSGLILHEIAFDHVTQRQHHVHSMAANCEMFSMSPIKVLSNYLEHIFFSFLTPNCRLYVTEYTCETVSAYWF